MITAAVVAAITLGVVSVIGIVLTWRKSGKEGLPEIARPLFPREGTRIADMQELNEQAERDKCREPGG